MTRALHSVLCDEGLRQKLIAAGKNQARKFTWDRCARETLSVYEELGARFGARKPVEAVPVA
jgi:alpha-1,3-rhamnosyl/mannosyltransferase